MRFQFVTLFLCLIAQTLSENLVEDRQVGVRIHFFKLISQKLIFQIATETKL
jgi:hypothetical protein